MNSFLTIILSIASGSHWRWFDLSKVFAWGDYISFIRVLDRWRDLLNLPQVWDPTLGSGFGDYNLMLFYYPFHLITALFVQLTGNVNIVTNFIFLLLPSLLIPLTMYLGLRCLKVSKISSLAGSTIYSLNTYILISQAGGQLHFVQAAVWIPLALIFLKHSLDSLSIKSATIVGLMFFMVSCSEFRIFYIFFWIFLIYFFLDCLKKLTSTQKIKEKLKLIIKTILIFTVSCAIYVGLSSYWLVPFVSSGSTQSNIASIRSIFGDKYMDLAHAITLSHPFWTSGNGSANGVVQEVFKFNYILPILAICGLILNFKNRLYWFSFLILCLGILFAKQSAPPYPNLYRWFFDHFPGFYAYRESSKFYLLTSFGFSLTVPMCIDSIRRIRGKFRLIGGFFAISIIIFTFNKTLPLINGSVGTMFSAKSQPSGYQVWNEFISKDNDLQFRTLWVPYFTYWSYYTDKKTQVGLYDLYYKYESTLFKDNKPTSENIILTALSQDFSENMLRTLGIKYVVIPAETTYPDDDVFKNYGFKDRGEIEKFLSGLKYLHKVSLVGSNLEVYETKSYASIIFSSKSADFSKNDFNPIKYEYVSPGLYKLPNLQSAKNIHFVENYNNGWELVGQSSGDSAVKPMKTSLDTMIFNPSQTKAERAYFIKFKPQEASNKGILISIFTGCIICTILYKFKSHKY